MHNRSGKNTIWRGKGQEKVKEFDLQFARIGYGFQDVAYI